LDLFIPQQAGHLQGLKIQAMVRWLPKPQLPYGAYATSDLIFQDMHGALPKAINKITTNDIKDGAIRNSERDSGTYCLRTSNNKCNPFSYSIFTVRMTENTISQGVSQVANFSAPPPQK
jgi:hypothetical protein